jgi:altronate hydrolase
VGVFGTAGIGELFGRGAGESKHFAGDGVDMGAHGGDGGFGIGGGNGTGYRLVLGERGGEAARIEHDAAGPIEIGAGAFDDGADAAEAHGFEQDLVEDHVELVEILAVGALHGLSLRGEIAGEVGIEPLGLAGDEGADRLALQRLADEHVLDHVADADAADHRAALRHDLDQPLRLQARQGLGDGEAGDAEPLAQRPLVEDFAGLEVEADDGAAEFGGDVGGDGAAPRTSRGDQKFVRDFCRGHANMLVGGAPQGNRCRRFPSPVEIEMSEVLTRPSTTLLLNAADNVGVALANLDAGTTAEGVVTVRRVPRGHKFAIRPIAAGEAVVKFGQIIGFAKEGIPAGDWVHEHNCGIGEEHGAFERDYAFGEGVIPVDFVPAAQRATFQGYKRSNGTVGTRNYVGILTSVNCSATVAGFIAQEIERSGILNDYPNIDGVIALKQSNGCIVDSRGVIFDTLRKTTWGYATNPNMGGVIMVGLGCEGFQIPRLKEAYGVSENETFRTMTIQEQGGTRKTVEAGVEAVKAMLPTVNNVKRETVPASEITLALQCGGSDGYSGITANPALGYAADILVRHGGTAILSETPEIYGAEHLLTRRAKNREVGQKLIDIIHWWEDYTARNNMEMNNNPSPGNKLGGLTTILEKSLGAAAKGGTTPLNAVYNYADPVTEKGFVFMDTPGYDPVSATGQVAGGANMLSSRPAVALPMAASRRPRSRSRRIPRCITG